MTETSTHIPLTDETFPFTRSAAGQPKFRQAKPIGVASDNAVHREHMSLPIDPHRPRSLDEVCVGATCGRPQ